MQLTSNQGDGIQPINIQLLKKFEPKPSWLFHDSCIHGVDHMARVFILQELICDQLEAKGGVVNREAVRWGAMTHDVGRLDDGLDREHGQRSAQWIKEYLSEQMSPELLDTVTYIVHWHVPADNEAPVMTTELKVLKDADALDRVRLGDLNPNYLRTDAARYVIEVAENLYQAYLNEPSDGVFTSVIKAAQKIGVVEKT
jgi:hypothetical protein